MSKKKLIKEVIARSARDLYTGELVAIKLEKKDIKRPQVIREARIVKFLHTSARAVGIPEVIYFGDTDGWNVMVQELLGRDLEELFNLCNRTFSLRTVLMLADQVLKRIEYVHSRDVIHRDIKPQNWTLGVGAKSNLVYLFDFGLAKRFRRKTDKVHIDFIEGKNLVGTARFASISNHKGFEQSRRDDLEAIGYMFVYFLKGRLPWQGLQGGSRVEKYRKIMEVKEKVSLKELCEGIPEQFQMFLKYVRELDFDEDPDYTYLKKLFSDLFNEKGYKMDFLFDWLFLRIGIINTNEVQIKPSLEGGAKPEKFRKCRPNPQL